MIYKYDGSSPWVIFDENGLQATINPGIHKMDHHVWKGIIKNNEVSRASESGDLTALSTKNIKLSQVIDITSVPTKKAEEYIQLINDMNTLQAWKYELELAGLKTKKRKIMDNIEAQMQRIN